MVQEASKALSDFKGSMIHRAKGRSHILGKSPKNVKCPTLLYRRSPSAGKLLVKCQLDPLDVMAQLDGRAELQVHALLYSGKVQQKQRLTVNFLEGK